MTKKNSYRTGIVAEHLCQLALRLKGYRILAIRYRSPRGEIDIVAQRGNMIAAIEVKARKTERDAVESVLPRQRQRIENAAHDFLTRQRRPNLNLRFDVMLVMPRRWPKHIPDAWRP